MFDASRLVLSGGDRYRAKFACAAERPTGFFGVTEGGGLYLSREEALAHALTAEIVEKFYRVEEYEKEEPKGIFTSIAVCGFSGALIGPPNHHSYQNNVRKLHRERFANMTVEDYKRRIKVEADPEVVEKWKEQEKKGMRWTYRPSEEGEDPKPLVFENRVDVEAHFRRTHGDDVVREMREVAVGGDVARDRLSPGLGILMRQAVERAQKHLFEMSQKLAAGLERRGLKTFKRRSGKFYISRVRPRAIPEGLIFADRLAQIVNMLKGGAGIKTKQILDTLAPVYQPEEGETKLSDEQVSVLKDLHWLANEGYVIEYSDGMVFLGVQGDSNKPKEKKTKPAPETTEGSAPDTTAPEAATPEVATSTVESPPVEPPASEAPKAEAVASEPEPEPAPAPSPEPEPPVSSTEEAPPPPDDEPPAPEPGPATVEEPPPAPEPEVAALAKSETTTTDEPVLTPEATPDSDSEPLDEDSASDSKDVAS